MADERREKAVLIVEDDDGWATLIRDEIADAGLRPVRVRTVGEARTRLEQANDISLVVTDAIFGRSAEPLGLEFAQWLRREAKWRNLPIVFCTAVRTAVIAAKLGPDNVVVFRKPFDFRDFSDAIKAILAKGAT